MKLMKAKGKKNLIIPVLCIATIAILFVPMLYSSIYLGSIWDVYGKIDKVPVAFVNSDKSITKDGKKYDIGKEVQDSLKDNKKVSWRFVSHEKAIKGVEGTDYYAMIEIPSDFSEKIANAQSGDMNNAQIIYTSNKGKNFVFSQISSKVADSIKNNVSSSIQKEISKALVDSLYDVKDSINNAGQGTKELQSGTEKLLDGSSNLSNGLSTATDGSKKLLVGLQSISDGQAQIVSGSSTLLGGLNSLKSSLTTTNDKVPTLVQGANDLDARVGNVMQQANTMNTYVTEVANNVREIDASLNSELDKINNSNLSEADKQSITDSIKKLDKIITTDNIGKIDPSSANNNEYNINVASAHINQLAIDSQAAKGRSQVISAGVNTLAKDLADSQSKAAAGVDGLIAGANNIQSGSNNLLNGLNTATTNTKTLVNGLEKLNSGETSLKNGLQSANDGASKLSNGLNDGYNKLNSKLTFNSDNMSKFISNPVTIKDNSINNVKHYGQGLAPYFISLSLWLGAMFINGLITFAKNKNVFKSKFMNSFIGKFVLGVGLVAIQAVILSFALRQEVRISPESITGFYVANVFISVVFFSIMYGLSYAIGILSTPIMFILLLVQLASSAGTFPIETAPLFYRVVNKIVPMTYSVSTLRMVLSGINSSVLHHNIFVMLIFTFLFLVGGFMIRSIINKTKKEKQTVTYSEAA